MFNSITFLFLPFLTFSCHQTGLELKHRNFSTRSAFLGLGQFFLGSSESFSTKSQNKSQHLKEEEHHLETALYLVFRYSFISVLC